MLELAQNRTLPRTRLVPDLSGNHELDLKAIDVLEERSGSLGATKVELRLGGVHLGAAELLRRAGLAGRTRIAPTIDAAAEPFTRLG